MTNKAGSALVKLVIGFMLVNLLLIGYAFYLDYSGKQNVINTQRKACLERGKTANTDNADFQTAHTIYIRKVVLAQSVQEDVKRAAREAIKTFKRTSADLRHLAAVDCYKEYPNASLLP